MMVSNLKANFSCEESRILFSNSKVKAFFVRPLSELHVSSRTIYIINTDMAVSLADFTAFFQDEGEIIKRDEKHYKSGHVESCSYSNVDLCIFIVRGGKTSERRHLRDWCCSLYNYVFSQAKTSTVCCSFSNTNLCAVQPGCLAQYEACVISSRVLLEQIPQGLNRPCYLLSPLLCAMCT